ncbi:hypothetical protein [Nocardioides sp.]|uniref:hypothetical protein n=1 Tax=Nocardioides sp. TaxID=35761 RepID=UPI00286C4DD9|nr:hypothetical protein [Nocardioides sp.]
MTSRTTHRSCTIKEAAALTGLPASTLRGWRAWQQRACRHAERGGDDDLAEQLTAQARRLADEIRDSTKN